VTLTRTQPVRLKSRYTDGLENLVGNTPLIRLGHLTSGLSQLVQVFGKAEWFNPSGSVKDRPAIHIIREAIANGDLGGGKRLLDSTSGNMGIAYATFGAAFGIPVSLCVPANASPERLIVLRALGAEVVPTDASEGSDGTFLKARKMAASRPDLYWYANQNNNPANSQAQYVTTGPELLSQTNGAITHLVAGVGTSGTLIGAGRYLREQVPGVQILAVQPDAAFHGLEGLKHMPSVIRPGIFEPTFADRTMGVTTEAADGMVRDLARLEGLFVGISSGAAVVAALKIASELSEGIVVAILPDAGYKYVSEKALWEGQ
jgi:cysteine synthase B